MTGPDSDPPSTPQESLAIVEEATARARAQLAFRDSVPLLAWGAAWTLGFGVTHLIVGGADPLLGAVPEWVAGAVWVLVIAAASLVSGVHGARHGAQLDGRSSRMGARIAICWAVALTGAFATIVALGLAAHEIGALFVFTVAVLYLGQGAVFVDDLMLGLGAWFLVLNVAALVAGPEVYSLLLAVGGGGGLLAGGLLARRNERAAVLGHAG